MHFARKAAAIAAAVVTAALLAPASAQAHPVIPSSGCRDTLYAVSLGNPASGRNPNGSLSLISTVTGRRLGTPKALGLEPGSMAFSPDNTLVYVTNNGTDDVSVYSTETGDLVATIPVGDLPTNIAMNPNGRYVYVTNTKGSSVSVINTATRVVDTVTVASGPYGLAVAPDGSTLYVAGYKGATTIAAYALSDSGATLTATGSPIAVGTSVRGMKVSPDGTRLYATAYASKAAKRGSLWVVDTSGFTVATIVRVGAAPTRVALNADGSQAWVTNLLSGTVSVVDTASNTVVRTVRVGLGAFGISFNAAGDTVFVASAVRGRISRINAATYSVHKLRVHLLLPDNVAVCGALPHMQA